MRNACGVVRSSSGVCVRVCVGSVVELGVGVVCLVRQQRIDVQSGGLISLAIIRTF